jgi:hypothetical protein
MTFFGLPPFFPFARAAATFAGVVALPPLRPSAAACGFLAAMRGHLGFQRRDLRREARKFLLREKVVMAARPTGGTQRHGGGLFSLTHTGGSKGIGNSAAGDFVRDHVERINPSDWDVNNKMKGAA